MFKVFNWALDLKMKFKKGKNCYLVEFESENNEKFSVLLKNQRLG